MSGTAANDALLAVWEPFAAGERDGLDRCASDGESLLFAGLLGLSFGHPDARAWIRAAGELDARTRVPALVARHRFAAMTGDSPYEADPDAFTDFVAGGSNPDLYAATAAALRPHVRDADTLLDIGAGDGRVVQDVLEGRRTLPGRVDLVEPSSLAEQAAARCGGLGFPLHVHRESVQEFLARGTTERWDVAQSTYCLHGLPPQERTEVLSRVRERADSLLLVEFDVPEFPSERGPERFAHYCNRYELGLAEYAHAPNVVEGFLVPMFLRSLLEQRSVWEQSSALWAAELQRAGFTCETVPVFDYWWAPAMLVIGRAR